MAGGLWSERYLTGLDAVDHEHRELAALVERLAAIVDTQRLPTTQVLETLFANLTERARRDFDAEERLMAESGCDPRHAASHIQEHAVFLQQLRAMSAASGADSLPALDVLQKFVASWLAYHILGADQALARQIGAIRAGGTAEAAFRQEAQASDDAHAALLDALGNMINLVVSRNAALGDMQDMLRRANLELEAKVEARTHALECANAELTALVERLEAAQNQLLQSEKLASIGLLAAGVAHEINNPVGFVNSNLGSLKAYVRDLLELLRHYEAAEAALPETLRAELAAFKRRVDFDYLREDIGSLMDESRDGLERVTRIVQDLKEFSRADGDKWELADLGRGLDSTLNMVSNEIKYKAQVVREYANLPRIQCLPAQLNQVFMNLLVNAAQAIEKKGVITLRSGFDEEWVWVEVADTGAGMSEEVQKRVFEPFFTTKPVGKGTGLGLSLSYGIVHKHGGRIEVQSAPGEGSAFRVWLPRRQPDVG